jgi:hypothetical protein
VSIAACLLLYSLVVAVAGPPLLRRLTRSGHIPRLGVAVWLTAISSVLVSWLAAAALFIADAFGHWDQHDLLIASCVAMLSAVVEGDAGMAPQVVFLAVSAIAAVAIAVTAMRLARTLARMRGCSHDHAQSVRLIGHRTDADDVVIVDAPNTGCLLCVR